MSNRNSIEVSSSSLLEQACNGVHPGPAQDSAPACCCTTEQIRRRAYEIFLKRNGGPGNALSDWVQAEKEIKLNGAASDQQDRLVEVKNTTRGTALLSSAGT